jgi:hypothetical protein
MNIDTFIVQQFLTKRNKLAKGQATPARTRHHALNDAQRIATRAEGVAVLHVVADDETGEVCSIDVLARHGNIPDAFEEEIRAG